MRRILCIWLPNWPLQRLLIAQPELKRRAVALYEERRGLKIVACSRLAFQRGIVPGMPVAEAPAVHLKRYDPAADRTALEQLAAGCEPFSPTVGLDDVEPPECLLLDITGLASLFGDERSLAEQVARDFSRRGLSIRLAIADTIGAAWAAAHHTDSLRIVPGGETIRALGAFPVGALRLHAAVVEALAGVGIQRIRQLLSLPRSALASRFDPQLIQRLNQATGVTLEQIVAHRVITEITLERLLEYPVSRREIIDGLLAQLINQAAAMLAERQQGAMRLECELDCETAGALRFSVGLFQASARKQHLRELMQTRLERLSLPAPVVAARLSVTLVARLQSRQRDLFDEDHDHRREFALLLDRLGSRLGSEAVTRAVPLPDAQPEYAYRYEPLAGPHRPRKKAPSGTPHRPLLVEPHALPLEVLSVVPEGPPIQFRLHGQDHRVSRSWGPERIQTGWWRGSYIRRDYYRVATIEGNRFWLFHGKDNWFLHGTFD